MTAVLQWMRPMPINKIIATADEAVADIHDGAVLLVGGFGTIASCPSLLLEALARTRIKYLTTVSNTPGFGSKQWKALGYKLPEDMEILFRNGQVKKAIVAAPALVNLEHPLERGVNTGQIELEMVSLGTLAERVRAAKAGIGAFYSPTGVGTDIEKGKESRIIDGRKYLLEYPIKADFGLIRAHKGDRWGNLVYRKGSRSINATMAGAARITIAEVDEIVDLGDLDPELIVTPGIYVDRVVARPEYVERT